MTNDDNTSFEEEIVFCIIDDIDDIEYLCQFLKNNVLIKSKFTFLHLTHFKIYNKGITWITSCLTKVPHVKYKK